jgi:hypothetical protein
MNPMNCGAIFLRNAMAMSLMAGLAAAWRVDAAPPVPVVPQATTRSIFTLPNNSKEGRDPFFPTSTHPYENAVATAPQKVDVSSLILKGFSVDKQGNRLVIINSHTFGVGDEEDVTTSQGRIHVHCLEIKGNTVSIEVNGERHELSYSANP